MMRKDFIKLWKYHFLYVWLTIHMKHNLEYWVFWHNRMWYIYIYIHIYIKWTVFVNVTTKSAQHAHARMIAIIVHMTRVWTFFNNYIYIYKGCNSILSPLSGDMETRSTTCLLMPWWRCRQDISRNDIDNDRLFPFITSFNFKEY